MPEEPVTESAEAGAVTGAVVPFRDVTERQTHERLVRDALDYALSILETLRGPFLVLSKDLRVVSGNRAFYETFGVQKEQTEGHFVYELGNGQWNIPTLRESLEDVLRQERTFDGLEVAHEFETIGRKVMLLNARCIRKPGDHSDLILLAMEDVTEGRQAEQDLRDSELRYRRLFESAKDGILILDTATGKIIDANAFIRGLVGLEASQLLGKELHEIGMFSDTEENKETFRRLRDTGYVRYEHLPLQKPDGTVVEVEFVANVYPEGSRLVAQCNVRDISERAQLQKQVAGQAEAMAEESRRKDEFLAMLSHELRNPLAPIRAAVHMLNQAGRGPENPIVTQAREIIERQSANLTKLVSDLMEVSRVISGRIRLSQQTLDLNRVVQHALETTTPFFEQRKHEVTLFLSPDPIWVTADATRMEEVFINLLNNAAKFTPDGGRIEVRCERSPGSDYGQVRVRDNGIGIEAKLLPRIFDLFAQADRSLARSAGGLGIGLSIANRIVALHGGSIEARSPLEGADEGGSEFTVRLALMAAPLAVTSSRHDPFVARAARKRQKPDGLRVLVVDDNVDLVQMLAASLVWQGHAVQSAFNGPDGLKAAQEWQPDVVLLDIGLPGLDGYEVARRLRSDPADAMRKMKLIAVTGYGRDSDIALTREAGFDAHLVKPVDFNDLEKVIQVTAGRA